MIREAATLSVDPAQAAPFEAAVTSARPLFMAAEGCHDLRLERVIEQPGTYLLLVRWTSVAAHEAFRLTPGFQEWRALAGPFFTRPPQVVHLERIA